MHRTTDLIELPATRQAELLRTGEIGAVELVTAHLDRIERFNPLVNAIVTLDPEDALRRAREADAVRAPERRGPLHGLPIAIKDTARTAGMRTTFGHPLFADNVPTANDLHVERIMAAGAIRLGKTNVPELAAGSHTKNRVFGATRNPHDLSRSVGGSSGGAAAALAARFQPIADGSDMGGSLRNPASFCGVVGIRPTPGLVPNADAPNAFNPLVTNGPLGRTVEDAALLLSVIAAPSPAPRRAGAPDGSELRRLVPAGLRGLRVAYAPDLGGRVPVAPEVRAVIEATARLLASAGAHVEPACPDLDGADEAFRTLRAAEFDQTWHAVLEEHPDGFTDFLAENIRQGRSLSGRDVLRACIEVTRLTRAAERFFGDHDLVLAPVAQLAPFPVEVDWPREVDGVAMGDYLDWMRAAWLFTPLGVPALSLPAGFTPDGLPVGAQLIGPAGDDAGLLAVSLAIEQAIALPLTDPFEGARTA